MEGQRLSWRSQERESGRAPSAWIDSIRPGRDAETTCETLEARTLMAMAYQEFAPFPPGQPELGVNPTSIVKSPQGDLWYVVRGSNRIIRFHPNQPVASPPTSETPQGLAYDAGRNVLWYTAQNANKVGRYNPATNQITEYNLPTASSYPTGITVGPDGMVWFTLQAASKIGRLNPANGQVTEYTIPTANSSPYAITNGPGGTLWFTSYNANKVGRLDPATGQITEFATPTAKSGPLGITTGPDGKIWFTEFAADRIARLDPATGQITEFALPRPAGTPAGMVAVGPQGIAAGPGGYLYFTQSLTGRVGRINSAGTLQEFPISTVNSRPTSLVAGPDGSMWITLYDTGKIGRLTESASSGAPGDFDGDGRSDLAVFRVSTAQWLVRQSGGGVLTNSNGSLPTFGAPNLVDIPIAADFDGDGKTDMGVFRAPTAQWLVRLSGGGVLTNPNGSLPSFGAPNLVDIPIPGDYDGDGRADLAVFRAPTSQWLVKLSSGGVLTDANNSLPSFGAPNLMDIPVPADYDGDGKTDLAVFRPATAQWLVRLSGGGVLTDSAGKIPSFGAPNLADIPIPGDYDGDGRADLAVFRKATSQWLVRLSGGGVLMDSSGKLPSFGAPNFLDVPIQAPIPSLMRLGILPNPMSPQSTASRASGTASLMEAPSQPRILITSTPEPDSNPWAAATPSARLRGLLRRR